MILYVYCTMYMRMSSLLLVLLLYKLETNQPKNLPDPGHLSHCVPMSAKSLQLPFFFEYLLRGLKFENNFGP